MMDMIPQIDAGRVAESLPFPHLIDWLAVAFARGTTAPLRQRIDAPGDREMLVMPAVSERYAGVKLLTIVPDNPDNGRPLIHGLFTLFDLASGEPLAILDAAELTARRTAAVSALAARALARADASTLLLLGSGHLVPYLAEAHSAARPIRTVRIWARDAIKAAQTADRIRDRIPGIDVHVVADVQIAMKGSDIISAATRATAPLIMGRWLEAGMHIDLVGGYRPHMREIDDAGIARARLFVDTRDAALVEAGDLVEPIARHIIGPEAVQGDLQDLVAGCGRRSADEITLFKSVGTAAADLAAAELVWNARR